MTQAKRHASLPTIAFLCTLAAIGTGLRLYRLETGLWFDEIATLLESVRRPLGQIVTHFPSNNDHPLYSVLAHVAVSTFGESPWALRLPAVLFGVAAIPLLYACGIAVTNRLEAAAASLILTFSYHHIWFSQNARGYTMLLVSALVATLALVRWQATGERRFVVLYAVATALGAYAHLTMVLVSVSHAVVLLLAALIRGSATRARTQWRMLAAAFLGAAALTAALYLPMLGDVAAFFTTSSTAGPAAQVATPLWALLATLRGLEVGFGQLWAIGLGGLVFAAGAWSYVRQGSTVALLLLLPAPATLLVMAAMNRPIRPRFVFFAIGFVLLVTARGAASLGSWCAPLTAGRLTRHQCATVAVVVLVAGALGLSVRSLSYGYRFPKQDYAEAVRFVEQNKGDGIAAAIASTSALPVLDYLERPWQRVDTASQFRAIRDAHTDVWILYTFPAYIEVDEPELWAMLQNECRNVREFHGTVEGGAISIRRCP